MITRDSHTRAPLSARAPRTLDPVKGVRGERHNALGCHSPVAPKLSDELREYLANQPRLVLIGVSGTARTFQFIDFRSFHGAASNQGSQPDNVA